MTYLFKFAGRMSRSAFWSYHYGIMALTMVPLLICAILSFNGFPNWIWWTVGVGFVTHQIAALSGVVRRFHDRNLSGWWVLFSAVATLALVAGGILLGTVLAQPYSNWAFYGGPVAGMAITLWVNVELFFRAGRPGPNRFGPPPE